LIPVKNSVKFLTTIKLFLNPPTIFKSLSKL